MASLIHGKDSKAAIDAVAQAYGVSVADLLGRQRHESVAMARMVGYLIIKIKTDCTWQSCGAVFGRDHSTAYTGAHRALERIATYAGDQAMYNRAVAQFHQLRHAPI